MSRRLLCAHNQLWLLTHFFVTEQIHPLEVLNSIAHGSLSAAVNEAVRTKLHPSPDGLVSLCLKRYPKMIQVAQIENYKFPVAALAELAESNSPLGGFQRRNSKEPARGRRC